MLGRRATQTLPWLAIALAGCLNDPADLESEMAGTYWFVELWNLPADAGEVPEGSPDRQPDATGTETEIAHAWGTSPPSIGGQVVGDIGGDRFAARWTRQVQLVGIYRFMVTADDGLRITIRDGQDPVWISPADLWGIHGPTSREWTTGRLSGTYTVEVEYFEHGGDASVAVDWECALACADGWTAEYFDDWPPEGITGEAEPIATRVESQIQNRWRRGGPVLPNWEQQNLFSVRWTRTYFVPAGDYTFDIAADDGVRLSANGQTVIDEWHQSAETHYSAEYHHAVDGELTLVVEYFEAADQAVIEFRPPWDEPDPRYPQWKAEYWDNQSFDGNPAIVRNEAEIDHQWGRGFPEEVPGRFSARYSREIAFDEVPKRYRFELIADGDATLSIGGTPQITITDDDGRRVERSASTVVSGLTPVELSYSHPSGSPAAGLTWELDGAESGDLVVCDPPGDVEVEIRRVLTDHSQQIIRDDPAPVDSPGGLAYRGLRIDYEKYGEYGQPYVISYFQGHSELREYRHEVRVRGDGEACAEEAPPGCEWLRSRSSCAR